MKKLITTYIITLASICLAQAMLPVLQRDGTYQCAFVYLANQGTGYMPNGGVKVAVSEGNNSIPGWNEYYKIDLMAPYFYGGPNTNQISVSHCGDRTANGTYNYTTSLYHDGTPGYMQENRHHVIFYNHRLHKWILMAIYRWGGHRAYENNTLIGNWNPNNTNWRTRWMNTGNPIVAYSTATPININGANMFTGGGCTTMTGTTNNYIVTTGLNYIPYLAEPYNVTQALTWTNSNEGTYTQEYNNDFPGTQTGWFGYGHGYATTSLQCTTIKFYPKDGKKPQILATGARKWWLVKAKNTVTGRFIIMTNLNQAAIAIRLVSDNNQQYNYVLVFQTSTNGFYAWATGPTTNTTNSAGRFTLSESVPPVVSSQFAAPKITHTDVVNYMSGFIKEQTFMPTAQVIVKNSKGQITWQGKANIRGSSPGVYVWDCYDAPLNQGENTIEIKAKDVFGNVGWLVMHTDYTIPVPISININGPGQVFPKLTSVNVGQQYTITAIPNHNDTFSGWVGSISNDLARITFTAEPNMIITANFMAQLPPGFYTGSIIAFNVGHIGLHYVGWCDVIAFTHNEAFLIDNFGGYRNNWQWLQFHNVNGTLQATTQTWIQARRETLTTVFQPQYNRIVCYTTDHKYIAKLNKR